MYIQIWPGALFYMKITKPNNYAGNDDISAVNKDLKPCA
ncbi:hypothetical protein PVOR_31604 [Paenibacillus vortex V453]|uniref:Uncharacterized protein n=1 Tax=Paenibacillus vortex V453 TaxID=715225 RepID=A0A2R9SLB1_9BACL|nr:hypothetical protein PVOR_31604 [Paenibacillus vortex V453]